jgi:hypothetical protein
MLQKKMVGGVVTFESAQSGSLGQVIARSHAEIVSRHQSSQATKIIRRDNGV